MISVLALGQSIQLEDTPVDRISSGKRKYNLDSYIARQMHPKISLWKHRILDLLAPKAHIFLRGMGTGA